MKNVVKEKENKKVTTLDINIIKRSDKKFQKSKNIKQ